MQKTKKNSMKTIDLFCGCGGMSLGFKKAGYQILAALDNWNAAERIYQDNFQDVKFFNINFSSDENIIKLFKEFSPDVVIAGPPCQDFSSAGKRNEHLGRGCLTLSFAEFIAKLKPNFFVMENVGRTVKTDTYKKAYAIFKKANYGLTVKVLDASLCGVPQLRKRLFVIGELNGKNDFLLSYLGKNLSKKPLTVREYFNDSLKIDYYYRHPRNYNRRAIFSIDEPSPTIRGVNRPIPKGYPGHPADSEKISNKIRALTTGERSYIQTFPKKFKLTGSKTELEQIIGNAVPVNFAFYVAKCLLEYVNDNKKIQVSLF